MICKDTSLLLNEIYSALKEINTRSLSILPSKIQLSVTGIFVVEKTLDNVLRYDGNYDLSKKMISTEESQENSENKIKQR